MSALVQHAAEGHHHVTTKTEFAMSVKESPASVTDTSVDERLLVRKIDLRVMPMLFFIYVAAFLDRRVLFSGVECAMLTRSCYCRVNISNALTMSLPKELGLVGQQPNIALTIFFVPYIIFEIPSNILMKRFQPHIWRTHCWYILIMTRYLKFSSFWVHLGVWNRDALSRFW
jgi:hypothetical protein